MVLQKRYAGNFNSLIFLSYLRAFPILQFSATFAGQIRQKKSKLRKMPHKVSREEELAYQKLEF